MIDLHSHVLAGIDDGPATVDGSQAMLAAAAEAGIETMLATPHVSSRYRNDPATIAAAAAALAASMDGHPSRVEVLLGAEVAATLVVELDPAELPALCLGSGPWILLEPPFASVLTGLDATVAELYERGHRVVLAHPERCQAFRRDPSQLEALIDGGALASITSGSLVGRFGSEAKRMAYALLDAGLAHNVASDAHDAHGRPPSIAAELAASGYAELQDWLTLEVPAAILADEPIPPRPAVTRRARRRLLPWMRGRR
ncbi:MAG TPA: CpsB/CapC family capsule biosynthesis tyrosine phosphatase [Solirubrobacteraceae bacterium]|jgi:protein-tyrosine phosphatase|nr:CpsB/CapC family capsule biosynthesis tyrosine phosphatase [Solirubrobacteraceae bacterium]